LEQLFPTSPAATQDHGFALSAAIIECRYLYAFKGGSIFQPIYLGQRDDIPSQECTLGQLKYKPDLDEAAA